MDPVAKFQFFENELPSHFADRLGEVYSKNVTIDHKKGKGQFFTPTGIAHFMASLIRHSRSKLRILDPGCGTAVLSCSIIQDIILKEKNIEEIELVVYETDMDIIPFTISTLTYLQNWVEEREILFRYSLLTSDFVLDNKDCFQSEGSLFYKPRNDLFDIIISNPPYFKIGKDDKRAMVAKSVVWGQPNIYAIFLITAARLLKDGGELVFIIPRSFAAGNYFRAFREAFFKEIEIERIHLFNSRKDAFTRDNVLQETLILKGMKEKRITNKPILLSHSSGIGDLNHPREKKYLLNELVDLDSKDKILHLPSSEIEDKVIKLFKSWRGRLNKFDLQISTGPVVSFRAADYLYEKIEDEKKLLVPLYQLINTGKMSFEYPIHKKGKPQYIQWCKETQNLLVPNKNYILLRRFSAKDDKSRLVASPYFVDFSQAEYIGIENHLNYIYRPNGQMERSEILGLSALLNSKLFDTYFRTFNGNINVSATELREMPLPDLNEIKEIGNQIILKNIYSDPEVQEIVNDYFNLEDSLTYEQN